MQTITPLLMAFGIWALMYTLIFYTTHIKMTKDFTEVYGYGTYKNFIDQFNKYNWERNKYQKSRLFDNENNCDIHAGIIEFDRIGMIMKTPLDYFLVNRYIKWYIRRNHEVKLYQW